MPLPHLHKRISELWKNKKFIDQDCENSEESEAEVETSEEEIIIKNTNEFSELKFTLLSNSDSIQLSNIFFFSPTHNELKAISVSNIKGSSEWENSVSNLLDVNKQLYWNDDNYCAHGNSILHYIFNDYEDVKYYEFISSPNNPEADPVKWKLEGLNRNNKWIVLDKRNKYSPPTEREYSYGVLCFNYGIENLRKSISSVVDDNCCIQSNSIRLFSSGEVASIWTKDRGQLCSEYIPVVTKISIRNEFMSDTILKQNLTHLDKIILHNPIKASFNSLLISIIKKLFEISGEEAKFYRENENDPIYYNSIMDFYNSFTWRRDYIYICLKHLQDNKSKYLYDALLHLSSISSACKSKKIEIFHYIVNNTVNEIKAMDIECKIEESPKDIITNSFVRFLDNYKIKSFRSSFIEPTKYYFHLKLLPNNELEQVEIHCSNLYAALLLSTLGVQIPIMPHFLDVVTHVPPFLRIESIGVYFKHMRTSKYLGKSWNEIPKCAESVIVDLPDLPDNILEKENVTAVDIANKAIDKSIENEEFRKEIARYMIRFANLFSKKYIFEKIYLVLKGECEKELSLIFNELKTHRTIKEDSIDKWIYTTKNSKKFNNHRASVLFRHLGFSN